MTVSSGLPWGRPLTYADLDAMPEDGHRYELIDGVLLVSPSPAGQHQDAVSSLLVLLRAACPPDVTAFVAPLVPSLRCLELRGEAYEEVAAAHGDETVRLQSPFAVELAPSSLVEA